jgi:hypothetical protein
MSRDAKFTVCVNRPLGCFNILRFGNSRFRPGNANSRFQDQPGSNDKADKFGDGDVDYDYTNDSGSGGSNTSRGRCY